MVHLDMTDLKGKKVNQVTMGNQEKRVRLVFLDLLEKMGNEDLLAQVDRKAIKALMVWYKLNVTYFILTLRCMMHAL
jgi:hypothetical protein